MQNQYLTLDGISKAYGIFTAVDNISLDIGKGEFFSLLGPSGCGKSTLLRMIAGFETPTAGTVVLEGADVTELPANRRPTNMMFQSYALFPHLNVARNIAFGLKQDRLARAEIESRVSEVARKLQLQQLLERKPSQLSGGQRQRVALARALVKRPKVLLLDEPLGALDKNLRIETQHELMRLQKELGLTFIIVTHDQHEAMTVSSRIAIMQSGRVLQVGTPDAVYEAPVSRYVAKFLGEANMFDVDTAQREGDRVRLTLTGLEGQFAAKLPTGVSPEGKLWLSVRPERMELATSGAGIPGVIDDISYTGAQRHYRVRISNGAIVDALKVNTGDSQGFERGDAVVVRWLEDAAYLLGE
ncbi:ABC transporter ATP-binding protein [Rhizobium helianthi]|uniref:Spermidine/putrescine import ATP-binding protein PotA n=1 Tax=Rhizobium helianthi TaxID=1132695 RepID=A0ABW4M0P5_9HYPH